MNVVCLVIDRLHAGYLGAYGNTWVETPNLDRLACRSLLLENALIDSPDLERLYRSYWQGRHALCSDGPPQPSLATLFRQAELDTTLLTDEPLLARHPGATDFDELVEIDPPWQPQTATRVEQTHFSRCFEQIIDQMASFQDPFLMWCHLGGLGTTWDAPLEFRQAYVEPDDPSPPEDAEVPERMLPADFDPDELLGVSQAYAGQVSLFDACLGAFMDFFDGLPVADETVLMLLSARGFPLGEHRRIGPCDDALYAELVNVPWMIKLPDGAGAAERSHALVEPADLQASLLDYCEIKNSPDSPSAESVIQLPRGDEKILRDRLCIAGADGARAIRTPAWFLRATDPPELYAKPDDYWEVNDVASLCPEVIECLLDALDQYEQTLAAGHVSDLPALNDILVNGLE